MKSVACNKKSCSTGRLSPLHLLCYMNCVLMMIRLFVLRCSVLFYDLLFEKLLKGCCQIHTSRLTSVSVV